MSRPKRANTSSRKKEIKNDGVLSSLLPTTALQLLPGSGAGLVEQIGFDVIRGIILDILTGKNIRDTTEALTRSRIAALNMAMVSLFLRGSARTPDFVQNLPATAADILESNQIPRSERWLARWILGLTDKGIQNILRDDKTAFKAYADLYAQICRETIETHKQEYGELTGLLKIGTENVVNVDWLFATYLLNAIGSQTLTIPGSNKASIGKLFEKLILGSLLSIFGFNYDDSHQPGEKVFWLSSRSEHRESDATLLYQIGKGVRFDIGFIGRGNSEISLDKVTRYQHEQLVKNVPFYMATIIIVDRIGTGSNIIEQARKVNGSIIQMSAAYWPQQVAQLLGDIFGFQHELITMPQSQIEEYLKQKLQSVPLESFIKNIPLENPSEVQQLSLLEEENETAIYDEEATEDEEVF